MITECRDPAFWIEVASHPEVAPHINLDPDALSAVIAHPAVLPLRGEGGGYLFHRLDPYGFVYDLHAMFLPDSWGKPAARALRASLSQIFGQGAQIITVSELAAWWRSRPPRSYGFQPAGPYRDTPLGPIRTWTLTRARWEQSPALKRMLRRCLQP